MQWNSHTVLGAAWLALLGHHKCAVWTPVLQEPSKAGARRSSFTRRLVLTGCTPGTELTVSRESPVRSEKTSFPATQWRQTRGCDEETLPLGWAGRGATAPRQEMDNGCPGLRSPREEKQSVFVLAVHAVAYRSGKVKYCSSLPQKSQICRKLCGGSK